MGTWGHGPFDNDTAMDFWGEVVDAAAEARGGAVRDAPVAAAGAFGGLEAHVAEQAVAAAALVVGLRPSGVPDHEREGISPDLTDLRGLADRALDRVTAARSELQDLWAESDGAAWRAEVARLREALGPVPDGADQG
ncbi:DUF4259 domain-containing protein [Nocardiopsis lucentensis]|uniref:DUF4259 domain-containing protein n=1 Tax=Nocardiopsis lucentensis TaxID=53441 RepID=UPI0003464633|nr:DUF4259 domain-containing protein [Nocardiopsis lucentensis]